MYWSKVYYCLLVNGHGKSMTASGIIQISIYINLYIKNKAGVVVKDSTGYLEFANLVKRPSIISYQLV